MSGDRYSLFKILRNMVSNDLLFQILKELTIQHTIDKYTLFYDFNFSVEKSNEFDYQL